MKKKEEIKRGSLVISYSPLIIYKPNAASMIQAFGYEKERKRERKKKNHCISSSLGIIQKEKRRSRAHDSPLIRFTGSRFAVESGTRTEGGLEFSYFPFSGDEIFLSDLGNIITELLRWILCIRNAIAQRRPRGQYCFIFWVCYDRFGTQNSTSRLQKIYSSFQISRK